MQLVAFTVLSSTLLLLAVIHSVYLQPDCSQAESCDLCVGDSMLNLTGCVWRLCPNGNDTGMCVTDEGDSADNGMNCSWTRVSELCTVVESVAAGGGKTVSGDDSNTNSSPEFSQAKFDMSSFIGGIILVLCLQAGGFFAMRFLKSKEQSSYDPIEQPQWRQDKWRTSRRCREGQQNGDSSGYDDKNLFSSPFFPLSFFWSGPCVYPLGDGCVCTRTYSQNTALCNKCLCMSSLQYLQFTISVLDARSSKTLISAEFYATTLWSYNSPYTLNYSNLGVYTVINSVVQLYY